MSKKERTLPSETLLLMYQVSEAKREFRVGRENKALRRRGRRKREESKGCSPDLERNGKKAGR